MKILIVEDSESMMELLEMALHREDFVIDKVVDGEAVLDQVKKHKYDVILLDIILPKPSGFSVIAALRAIGNDTPILAISSNRLVEARVKALNFGADDFLVKDFSMAELIARIKSLIRRKSGRRSNIFRCKALIVNFTDMTATYKQKLLSLTKKEFQILLLLLRNKNTVITREALEKAVWNRSGEYSTSNTIDVHILSLRKKLGDGQGLIRDRKSTRLNSSHIPLSRMPSSA